MTSPLDTPLPFVLDGRHRCTQLLASSATAVVYESTPSDRHTRCVAKVFRVVYRGDRGELLRAFYGLARLRHPNSVRLIDWGLDAASKHPYLVMERLMGTSMSRWIERYGHMAPAAAIRMLQGPLDALAMLHRKGWVHAALEPSNLFVSNVLNRPSVTLLGVGASVLGPAPAARPNRYTPPETRTQRPTTASDVYRMGVVLAEMIGGVEALDTSSQGVTIDPQLYPEQVWMILQRATSARAQDRYPNSDAFLSALATLDLSSPSLRAPRNALTSSEQTVLNTPSAQALFHTPVPESFRSSVTSSASHTSPFRGPHLAPTSPAMAERVPSAAAHSANATPTLTLPSEVVSALSSATYQPPPELLAQTPPTHALTPTPQALADDATVDIPIALSSELMDAARSLRSAHSPTRRQLANDATVDIPTDLLATLSSASSTALPQQALALQPSAEDNPLQHTAPTLDASEEDADTDDDALLAHDAPLDSDLIFDPLTTADTDTATQPQHTATAPAEVQPAPQPPLAAPHTQLAQPIAAPERAEDAPTAPAEGPKRTLVVGVACAIALVLIVAALAKLGGFV